MWVSIFTSVLQNRSFLSWKICFLPKICICLQNVIIFAKINSIFATNLNNILQTLRWKFSSTAISRHKYLMAFFTFFKSISPRFQQYTDVCMSAPCVCIGRREGKWVESLGKWKVSSSAQGLCNILCAKPRRRWREGKDGAKGREKKGRGWFIRADKGKSPEWEQPLLCFCALACETADTSLREYHQNLYQT